MDLYAYTQIDRLEELLKKNNIEVPRIRGLRLMSEEEPLNINDFVNGVDIEAVHDLCTSVPFWKPDCDCYEFSDITRRRIDKYIKNYWEENCEVRWERIHGKKRKILKKYIKDIKRDCKKQVDTFNKYVGRNDVLYIHAKLGSWSWFPDDSIKEQPWFLEQVDDRSDRAYCDIYVKLEVK